jgi:hypothetical protein
MAEKSNAAQRFGRLAGACTVLSIVACYGTLATVSVLSLLGVTLAIHKGVWAGPISLFALLALFGVALGYRVHRGIAPLVFAALGAGAILRAMFGSYSRVVELMGFAGLITGSIWDWRLKKVSEFTRVRAGSSVNQPGLTQSEASGCSWRSFSSRSQLILKERR